MNYDIQSRVPIIVKSWCIGQEKQWQTCLKRLTFLPIILLPIVIVVILVTRHNVGSKENTGLNLHKPLDANNHSFIQQTERRQKRQTLREERFSYLFKHCYKLYLKLHPDKESFLEIENNRESKLNYINKYPTYFTRNFRVFSGKNRGKHRSLKKCLKKFQTTGKTVDISQEKKYRKKRNITKQGNTNVNQQTVPFKNEVRNFWSTKNTPEQVRELQSKVMQKYMNQDVDPCHNFYEYACGNWKKYYDVPPDKAVYDTFEIVRENLYFLLKDLLEGGDQKQTNIGKATYHDPKTFVDENYVIYDPRDATIKAKIFYRSCMNEEIINKRAEKPLQKLLEELGGWPVITPNWKKSDFDLMWVLSRLRLLNNDILISQWIGPDIKNSHKYIIHIDQTTLGLPSRDYFLDPHNSRYIKAYKSFILSIANLMGAQTSSALKEIDDIVEFETKLAAITSPLEERRNITEIYQSVTVELLLERFPHFAWKTYFSIILGKEIDLKSPVACYCARYIHQLLILLNKTNPRKNILNLENNLNKMHASIFQIPTYLRAGAKGQEGTEPDRLILKIIQNYLLWRFIRHRSNNLDHRFMESEQKFYHTLFGREKQTSRWQFCVTQTNTNMGMALGSLFIEHYFDKSSKTDTIKITEGLMQAFVEMLHEKNWLDHQTKNFAKTKIKHMDLKIGFPNSLLNETLLNMQYSDVKVEENFFFENVLSVLRHSSKEDQEKVNLLVNKTLWSTPPAVVNAYYSRNKNQIMFPAGILQPPFYHKFFPKAINFGGIGVVIGHEITHGFDDKGRLFDHKGNLQLWWKNAAIEHFYEKSQCIIDQYGKYVLPGLKIPLDGVITQGENIADNGGLKQAFRAYSKWTKANPEVDETLPGLNMTGAQLFFLNYAQVWCGKQRTETARSRIKTSVHSPGIFRVIGALSNSEEFSQTYNCPNNSLMNPQHKCVLW